ncbi:conjugal transfer protein TraO [Zobellia sp. B3R18]|uniref:conjugal transfer protein TraO n=1 Tax=Zobellia sp. B3R18 TaxID=2841568 RepID=UPI001C07690C|nr:conjugal transfer protein TraO [Zobellia sp. B3R18]MBU2976034.1 conjugal transfer protein TraO [Zobellia sp. B3R18]
MKHITIIFSLLCFPILAFSQTYSNTFSVSGGLFGDGYGGEITYNTNLSETTHTQIALNGTYANYKSGAVRIPYMSVTASYSYFITVYSRNRKMQSLSLGGGALAGYESVNNGNLQLSNIVSVDGESKFIYGGVVTADLDIILTEHLSLLIKTSEFYHVNSDFGNLTNYSGLGIRYYFN